MAEDKIEAKPGEPEHAADAEKGEGKPAKKEGKKSRLLLIIAPIAAIALAAGGYFGYTFLSQGKGKAKAPAAATAKTDGKVRLFSIDPFVVNLSEPGRYLKVTMQFELAGGEEEKDVNEKVPIMRDLIITLIGNQTYEYAASTEGKTQLKDEILLRTNRLFGKEVFRNLYFTDFVMQ